LPTLAAELVAQRPAVIVTFGDATGLCSRRHYSLPCADASSVSSQSLVNLQCINGLNSGRGRSDRIRSEPTRCLSSGDRARRQGSTGCKTRRSSSRATN
jgi:hypothetical protein